MYSSAFIFTVSTLPISQSVGMKNSTGVGKSQFLGLYIRGGSEFFVFEYSLITGASHARRGAHIGHIAQFEFDSNRDSLNLCSMYHWKLYGCQCFARIFRFLMASFLGLFLNIRFLNSKLRISKFLCCASVSVAGWIISRRARQVVRRTRMA
jgi:hypothetical protein